MAPTMLEMLSVNTFCPPPSRICLLFLPSNSTWMEAQPLPSCCSFSLLPHSFFKVCIKVPSPACCSYHSSPSLKFICENISRFPLSLQWWYLGQLALWNLQLDKLIHSKPLAWNDQLPNYFPEVNHMTHCSDWVNRCQCWQSSFNFLTLQSKKFWVCIICKLL